MKNLSNLTSSEKLKLSLLIRRETGCGLHDSLSYFDKFIEALRHRGIVPMDNPPQLDIKWKR